MAQVLSMTAGQQRNPVTELVALESDDGLIHGRVASLEFAPDLAALNYG